MRSEKFWGWFDEHAAPRLTGRDKTFREMFNYLDRFDRPVHIVETGCIEDPENWAGNGCSTIQFDRYVDTHPGSTFWSVDIVPEKVWLACKHVIGDGTDIVIDDSVNFLRGRAQIGRPIDLLYLDASHFFWTDPVPSQLHHLNELMAAMPALHEESIVAVDDSPAVVDAFPHADVGGKGGLVARYLFSVGADLAFLEYQAGWTNPTAKPERTRAALEKLVERARAHVEGDRLVAASPLYNLILTLTMPPPPLGPHERIARGEACAYFAKLALMLNRVGTAADWYREALKADPRATDYRIELTTKCLMAMGTLNAAQAEMTRATRIEPDHDSAWRVLGGVEHERGDVKAAIKAYDKQVALRPDDPDALLDRTTIALDVEDYALVKEFAGKALGTRRDADAWHMLAMTAYRENRHEDSLELFDRAIAGKCFDVPLAHWHKSLALQSIGRYREAWAEHAWRRDQKLNPALALPMKRFTAPLWSRDKQNIVVLPDGRNIRQAIVHVHGEAGAGDNLCLVRYLPQITALGFKVRFESLEELDGLFAYSFPTVEVVKRALDYPGALGIRDFDYHVPIGELQHAFDSSTDDVAAWAASNVPYLRADPILAERYRFFTKMKRPKVGLCWSSGIRLDNLWLKTYGRHKSMHFNDLSSLLHGDYAFVSLQVGPEREQCNTLNVVDVLPESPSWAETAALVSQLDVVVTVDSAVAHLAGALGKPVWLMMHTQGSWHWMVERPGSPWNERSPWYPAARIFRQQRPGEWADVVKRVADVLAGETETATAAE